MPDLEGLRHEHEARTAQRLRDIEEFIPLELKIRYDSDGPGGLRAKVEKILWVKSPASNLLVPAPAGARSAVASSTALSYLEGKEQAEAVARMYREFGVQLNPNCDLASHIAAAVQVSDHWLSGKGRRIQAELLFRGIQMDRIATSVLAAKGARKIVDHLRHLASGSVDILERRRSKAKNTLWELELHALLHTRSVVADLDEPDIVAQMNNLRIGIACKKIYSHKNVEKALSVGVEQIERVSEYGLLAINIDDLWPPNQMRVVTSEQYLAHTLSQENLEFLARHERYFRKYLSSGRVMGAMVASGGIAYVKPSYLSARQFTTWSMPGLEPAKAKLLADLQDLLQSRW